MGELIKFPIIENKNNKTTEDILDKNNSNVLKFKNLELETDKKSLKAFLSKDSPSIIIGGGIVVNIFGKKFEGIITSILQRDKNNNITKIAYTIPYLNSDDPLKFGEADFIYKIETHD